MGTANSIHEIKILIQSYHPLITIEESDEERVVDVCRSVSIQLKMPLFEWSIATGLRRYPDTAALYQSQDPLKMLDHLQTLTVNGIFILKDFSRQFEDASVLRKMREACLRFSKTRATIILTSPRIEIPAELKAHAVPYRLNSPSEKELAEVVASVIQSLKKSHGIKITAEKEDAVSLVRQLQGLSSNQVRQAVAHAVLSRGELSRETIAEIAKEKVRLISEGGLLEYFPPLDNRSELGGFEKLKAWLDRAKTGFSDQARELNLAPPKGILLVGVPGSGKSLAAKSIARRWNLPLLKLEMGRLYDKYIGESEKNFRRSTEMAEAMAPIVLWFDEIEKALQTGDGSQDGGLGTRILGQFLTWLQEKKANVFVVATANDLSKLPPELMRKGRFDEIFFVDLPNPSEREVIFQIHLELRNQDSSHFDLKILSEAAEGFTGAEIEQAVISSLYRMLHDKLKLTTDLIVDEIRSTVPLSKSQSEKIDELRRYADGRFVSVS